MSKLLMVLKIARQLHSAYCRSFFPYSVIRMRVSHRPSGAAWIITCLLARRWLVARNNAQLFSLLHIQISINFMNRWRLLTWESIWLSRVITNNSCYDWVSQGREILCARRLLFCSVFVETRHLKDHARLGISNASFVCSPHKVSCQKGKESWYEYLSLFSSGWPHSFDTSQCPTGGFFVAPDMILCLIKKKKWMDQTGRLSLLKDSHEYLDKTKICLESSFELIGLWSGLREKQRCSCHGTPFVALDTSVAAVVTKNKNHLSLLQKGHTCTCTENCPENCHIWNCPLYNPMLLCHNCCQK